MNETAGCTMCSTERAHAEWDRMSPEEQERIIQEADQ